MTTDSSQPKSASVIMAAVALTSWMAISSSLILLNKHLMVDDGFNFPLALTAGGQAVSCVLGLAAAKLGLAKLSRAPSLHAMVTQMLPIVICSAGTLYYGNVAYLYLPVAFIQVLKVATPLFTLGISAALGQETVNGPKILSVAFILIGSCIATIVEASSEGFSWYGLWLMVFSALLEAIKVVYIQRLLGKLRYNSLEMVVFLGPPTALLLGSASWILEGDGLRAYGFARMQKRPFLYLLALVGGFGVNLTTAYAIQTSSSLTFKVWGCMKNTAVVLASCLLGDVLNAWQLVGYAVSTLGFILYSWVKLKSDAHSPVKKGL